MSELYTTRTNTRDSVLAAVNELPLEKNEQGQYTRATCVNYLGQITTIAKEQFTQVEGSKENGIAELLVKGKNVMTNITTSSKANATQIMTKYNNEVAETATKATTDKKIDVPDRMTLSQARQEADDLNVAYQAVIGAKEGIAKGLANKFGKNITNLVLMDANGTPKSVDAYQLHELLEVILQNANRASNKAARKALSDLVNFVLDYRKTVLINLELIKTNAATLKAMKIPFPPEMIVLVLLANMEDVAGEDWARDFAAPMRDIRAAYGHDYDHTDTSLEDIVQQLSKADELRDFKEAPAPESANAVLGSTENKELIQSMMEAYAAQDEEYSSDDDESEAMAANYDSDASADNRRSHRRRARSQSGARGGRSRSRARVSESERKKNLECIHCEDFGRDNRHPNVSPDNCYYNPKFKGFRPKGVCDDMEGVTFRGKDKFTKDLSRPLKKGEKKGDGN